MVNTHTAAELGLPNDQFSCCQVISNNTNDDASDLSRSSPDACSAAPEYSPGSIKREYTSPSEDSPDSMKQDSDSPSPTGGNIKKRYNLLDRNVYIWGEIFMRDIKLCSINQLMMALSRLYAQIKWN